MTDRESEREHVAAAMDILIEFKRDSAEHGKTEYTPGEITDFLVSYAESVKIHK